MALNDKLELVEDLKKIKAEVQRVAGLADQEREQAAKWKMEADTARAILTVTEEKHAELLRRYWRLLDHLIHTITRDQQD